MQRSDGLLWCLHEGRLVMNDRGDARSRPSAKHMGALRRVIVAIVRNARVKMRVVLEWAGRCCDIPRSASSEMAEWLRQAALACGQTCPRTSPGGSSCRPSSWLRYDCPRSSRRGLSCANERALVPTMSRSPPNCTGKSHLPAVLTVAPQSRSGYHTPFAAFRSQIPSRTA